MGSLLWSGLSSRTEPHGRDPCWRSSWRTVSHGRDPTLEQGQSVRSPPPGKEGAAETKCDELTAITTPCPQATLGGRRERNEE